MIYAVTMLLGSFYWGLAGSWEWFQRIFTAGLCLALGGFLVELMLRAAAPRPTLPPDVTLEHIGLGALLAVAGFSLGAACHLAIRVWITADPMDERV